MPIQIHSRLHQPMSHQVPSTPHACSKHVVWLSFSLNFVYHSFPPPRHSVQSVFLCTKSAVEWRGTFFTVDVLNTASLQLLTIKYERLKNRVCSRCVAKSFSVTCNMVPRVVFDNPWWGLCTEQQCLFHLPF